MEKFIYVKKIPDKKNEGKLISAAFFGKKIGFPFGMKDCEGIFKVRRTYDYDNYFKFEGEPVEWEQPSADEVVSYIKRHALFFNKMYCYDDVLICYSPVKENYVYLTKCEGEVVVVEPFDFASVKARTVDWFNDYLDVIGADEVDDQALMSLAVRCYGSRGVKYEYFPKFKTFVAYERCYDGTLYPFRYFVGNTEKFNVSTWLKNKLESSTESTIIGVEAIQEYMREHFIKISWGRGEKIERFRIFIYDNELELCAFNANEFSAADCTQEEIDLVNESKARLNSFTKSLAKNLGIKSFLSISGKLSLNHVLQI